MIKTKITYFILPKKEFYSPNNAAKNLEEFVELFEPYKIEDATDKNINDAIEEYNIQNGYDIFHKLKTKEFLFCRVEQIKIGKYRTGKVEVLDLWKK